MKKIIIFLILTTLLLTFTYAEYETIHNDWMKSGTYINISKEPYRAIYIRENNRTVVYFPHGRTLLINPENSTCEKEWIYEVCQKEIRFEKKGQIVPADINEKYIDVFMNIEIKKLDLDIEIGKSLSKTELFEDDYLDIILTFNKTGTETIGNISFSEKYTNDFTITNMLGCTEQNNKITWQTDIFTDNSKKCSYTLIARKKGNYTIDSKIEFSIIGINTSKTIQRTINVIDTPLKLNTYIENKTYLINEENQLKINLEILKEVDISILKITYDERFKILSTNNLTQKENTLEQLDKVYTKGIYNITLNSSSRLIGSPTIFIELEYTYNSRIYKIQKELNVEYIAKKFFVDLYQKNNKSMIRVNNPSSDYFTDINVEIDNNTFYQNNLSRRTFKEWEFNFSSGKKTINIKYKTKNGQIITEKIILEHGESTYINTGDNRTYNTKPETNTKENTTVIVKPTTKKKNTLDPKMFGYLGITIFTIMVVLGIISMFKKGKKSTLDQEIEALKRGDNEE